VRLELGAALPRSVMEQYDVTASVSRDHARPGDLVFFAIDGEHVTHVAILVDDDTFVHAPSSRGAARVRLDHLSSEYWKTRLAGIRRVSAEP
jgi:cell wall-associated NlpC family hydrolase